MSTRPTKARRREVRRWMRQTTQRHGWAKRYKRIRAAVLFQQIHRDPRWRSR